MSCRVYADKGYDLDLNSKNAWVGLFLKNDNTFDITFNVEMGDEGLVVCVAHGNYQYEKDHLILYDSLWGTTTVLQRNGRNYKAVKGLQLFIGKNFVFKWNDQPTNDTNGFMLDAIRMQKHQRAKRDSIVTALRNGDQKAIPFKFQPKIYRMSFRWLIRFTNKGEFTYIIEDMVIAKGTWKQKGKYLILHCSHNNEDYIAEITAPNKINVIYFPLIDDSEAKFSIWNWDL